MPRRASIQSVQIALTIVSLLSPTGCEQGGQASSQVDAFMGNLSQGRLREAYDNTCPEFRETHSAEHFEQTIRSFPYLSDLQSASCMGWSTDGVLTERPCVIVNQYGSMGATVVTRATSQGACVVSLEVAGIPVMDYGVSSTSQPPPS